MSGPRIAMLALDGFVALTAIGGGIALLAGLEAERFPLDYLKGTPFKSFVGPGLLLAVFVGGSAALAVAATIVGAEVGAIFSIGAGAILVGYVAIEIAILNQPSWTKTEAFYIAIGAAIGALGALVLVVG
jgi:hypothetical protein